MTTTYFISGFWCGKYGLPEFYCVHKLSDKGISKGKRFTREQVISLLTVYDKLVYSLKWDYQKGFVQSNQIILIQGVSINTVPANDKHSELRHLINYDWLP